MMAPNRVKLEMLGQRIGQRKGCDPSADSSADRVGQFRLSHQPYCWPERGKSQGYGDSVPISKRSLPNSKKSSKKTLTKGGESSSACWQAGQGAGRGRGRPPHIAPQNAGYLIQADTPHKRRGHSCTRASIGRAAGREGARN